MRIREFTLSSGLMVNALRSIGLALDSVRRCIEQSAPHKFLHRTAPSFHAGSTLGGTRTRDPPLGISGTIVDSGARRTVRHIRNIRRRSDLGDLGAEAPQIAMIEQANGDGLKLVHGRIRQVGVRADDGTPEAIGS